MQKAWFSFLSAANKSARSTVAALLLLTPALSFGQASPTPAPTVSLLDLPEWPVNFVQKNANGNTYQIGDRISLYVTPTQEIIQSQNHFIVRQPEGGSSLEDQGFYLDTNAQLLSGTIRFIVSPLQPGSHTIPTLLVLKEDETPIARTNPLTLLVAEHKKKDPVPELKELTPIALATRYKVLFGLILLAIAGGSAYLIRRALKARALRKHVATMAPPKKDPDHVIALQELERLYKAHAETNLKPIAFGVSDILKTYFSTRFQIDARESTTDEMMALLRKAAVSNEGLKEIYALFNDLDLVKFTKAELDPAAARHSYQDFKNTAKSIIEKWASGGAH